MSGPNLPEIYYSFVIAVLLPYVVLKGALKKTPNTPVVAKDVVIRSTLLTLTVLGCFAICVDFEGRREIFVHWRPGLAEILSGLGLLAALLLARQVLLPWLRKSTTPLTRRLLPTSWDDLPMWAVISLCAGFFEEIIYRGVLFGILQNWTHSVPFALISTCLVFGVVHAGQGWRPAVFVTILSATLQILVIQFGNLYMAMIVHAAYDFLVAVLCIVQACPPNPLNPESPV